MPTPEHIAELERRLRRAKNATERIEIALELAQKIVKSDPVRARDLAKEAAEEASGAGMRRSRGRARTMEGIAAYQLNNLAEARALLQEGFAMAEEIKDIDGEAKARLWIGIVTGMEGAFPAAIESITKAITLYRETHNEEGEAAAASALGVMLTYAGNHARAVEVMDEGLQLAERIHASPTTLLLNLAIAHGHLGDQRRKVEFLRRAAASAERENDISAYTSCLMNLGNAFSLLGDFPAALSHFINAGAHPLRQHDAGFKAKLLHNIARTYEAMGDLPRALAHMQQALALEREGNRRRDLAVTLSMVGRYQRQLGNLDAASTDLEQSLAIARELGDRITEANVVHAIGEVACDRGELNEARARFTDALAIAGQIGNVANTLAAHIGLGGIAEREGRPDDAIAQYVIALAQAREAGMLRDVASVSGALAEIYEQRNTRGDTARALEQWKTHARVREELAGQERQKTVAAMQIRFDVERIERENEQRRIENERLKEDMMQKTSQLSVMALQLVERNHLLSIIRDLAGKSVREPEKSARTILADVYREVRKQIDADAGWKAFEEQFRFVNEDLFRALSAACPELSPMELKVCALLRLQLTTKDIATLLNVTTRAIEKHRLQARKKLGLSHKDNLVAYLAGV